MKSKFERFLGYLGFDVRQVIEDFEKDVEEAKIKRASNESEDVEFIEVTVKLSECRELALIPAESMDENMAHQAQLNKLQEEIAIFEEALKNLNEEFDWMNQQLAFRYAREIHELKTLREELSYLFNDRIQRQRNEKGEDVAKEIEEDLTVEDKEELDRLEKEMHDGEISEKKNKKNVKNQAGKMKKLLRKITQRTHPDRTDDTRLHPFFDAAIKAFISNDYEALLMIWGEIQHRRSTLWEALKERVEHLANKLLNTKTEYIDLKSSDDYKMLMDFKTPAGRTRVENHFENRVRASIRSTIEAIQSMEPNRHRPPPAKSHDAFKTNTKSVLNEENANELESPWVDNS